QAPDDIVQHPVLSSSGSLLVMGGVDFERRAETEGDSAPLAASPSLSAELRGSLSGKWGRLANTVNEANAIDGLFEKSVAGCERLLLTGDQPSEERLKRELPRHAYVHLA